MIFLKTEILKNFKLKHWQLLIIVCILVSFLKAYNFSNNGLIEIIIAKGDPKFKNAYFIFYRLYFSIINLGFPFIISVLCYTSIIFIEERYNMWIFHCTRSYYRKLHLYKLLSISLFLGLFICISFISSLIAIKLFINNLPNGFWINKPEHFLLEGILFVKFFFCSIGLLSLNYLIILFWPIKKLRLTATLLIPYLLLFGLPKIISPYYFLLNYTNDVAYAIRKISMTEADYSIIKIIFFGKQEWISLAYIVISLLTIWLISGKYKRFLIS